MSVVNFIRKALAMGVDTETALSMGEAFEAEIPVFVPPISATKDRKREYDRERMAARRKAEKTEGEERRRNDIGDVVRVVTTKATSCDIGGGQDARAPVHTRGENNLSRLVDTSFADVVVAEAREAGSDWPAGKAAHHVQLLVDAAASPRLDPTRMPDLVTTAGMLDAWKRSGASWEHDVLPVVTALTRKTGPPIRYWKYFDPAIAQSVADNRRALQIPAANGPRHERPDPHSPKFDRKQANLERSIRGAQSAARRGAF